MGQRWHISDFLDLEYFFIQDRKLVEEKGEEVLRERDRSLYLEEIEPDVAGVDRDREWLIYRWLQVRRSLDSQVRSEALLPGSVWFGLSQYGPFVVFLVMAMSGAGLAYSALSYSGKEPVNVSLFFLLFVVFQILLLLSFLLVWIFRRMRGRDLRSSYGLSLVNKGLAFFLRPWKYGPDSRQRAQFAAVLAAVRARGKGYGSLLFWPPFLFLQISGIAFNFGILGAILVKVAITDLAFGWQSTIQVSSQFVSTFVQGLALPWSWLLGSFAYPSLAQIEGSRMILKEGMYHLKSADLASWWPFLSLAIFCYCLLPRILLLGVGFAGCKRARAQVSFHRTDYNQLLFRLQAPRLKAGIRNREQVSSSITAVPVPEKNGAVEGETQGFALSGSLVALIPDELFAECDPQELDLLCRQAFGYGVRERFRINAEEIDDSSIFANLKSRSESCPPLFILQEAWQPPIQEMLIFIRELRKICDDETPIIVALVGKPELETIFTRPAETDLLIWRQKVATLGDLSLQVSSLVVK
ncbi:MAG: DUF2868 domain-containing protein [Pseudomonadota bacterium]|nr:DUF2868 domain-containing protein [Pseudomonadota bacterium]